jgi:hypothetical protein
MDWLYAGAAIATAYVVCGVIALAALLKAARRNAD